MYSTAGAAFYDILEDLQILFNSKSPFLLTNDVLHAPELKRLTLVSCSVEVEFGSFHNLSHLNISNTSAITSASYLHKVLLQTPKLEGLLIKPSFGSTLVSSSAVDSDRLQPVILPKLTRLEARAWDIEWVFAIFPMDHREIYIYLSLILIVI